MGRTCGMLRREEVIFIQGFIGKPGGMRLFGRSVQKWEDNPTMDL